MIRTFALLAALATVSASASAQGTHCGQFPAPGFDGPGMSSFTGRYVNFSYNYLVVIPDGLVGYNMPPPSTQHGFGMVLSWQPRAYVSFDASYNALFWHNERDALAFALESLKNDGVAIEKATDRRTRLGNSPARQQIVEYSCESGERRAQVTVVSMSREDIVDTAELLTTAMRFRADYRVFRQMVDSFRANSPAAVVEEFYTMRQLNPVAGLPTGTDLEDLRPFLSHQLHQLVVAALDYQKKYVASHPDEPSPTGAPVVYKPPFVDRDPFTSNVEGATSFDVRRASKRNGVWEVRVHFRYDPSLAGWEDVVVVVQQRGRYVIDDVLFTGAAHSGRPERLSDQLKWRESAR